MRCDVVLLLKRKEINFLLVGGLFTLARRSFTRSGRSLVKCNTTPFESDKTRIQWRAGPFSKKEVYCSEVGEQEK